MEQIQYFRRDRDHCMVAWKNLLIWFSVGEVDKAEPEEVGRYCDIMAKRHPDGFAFVLYARDNCKLPNSNGRRAASKLFQDQKGRLTGMVALFEGHGFFMASARAVISTILAVAKQPFETKVSGDVTESMTWLCQRTPGLRELDDGSAAIRTVLDQIVTEYDELEASVA